MPFVKLDCGILNSTLWVDRGPRDLFITALLMATPKEITEPMAQYKVRSLDKTGFLVPPGWYGFVQAAGPGIIRMAMVDSEEGTQALERLGAPDPESRSSAHEGRRLVRVDGGYLVLNFMRYRDKDSTGAERARRYRESKKINTLDDASRVTKTSSRVTRHVSSLAEAEAEADISLPNGKGGKPPMTTDEIIFTYGVPLLVSAGSTDKGARSFLGGLRKGHGDEALVNALRNCLREKPLQPIEWLAAALPPKGGKSKMNTQEALEASNRAVAQKFIEDRMNNAAS